MTNAISGNMSSVGFMQMQRPDPSKMASKLFSELDTENKGYLEKSDLQAALDNISGSSASASADDVFSQLDSDGDGKVTEDEMSSSLSKLAEELDSQFNSMRMNGFGGQGGIAGMNGMPPPPPADDAGFTKEELTSQLEEIGSSDSTRSDFISNVVNNFDEADADGDGKVSFKEAQAYNQSTSSDSSSDGSASTMTTASADSEAAVMKTIMQLMHAYGGFGDDASKSALSSLLSVSA